MWLVIIGLVLALLCLTRVHRKMRVRVTTPDGITIEGKQLMSTINTAQKVKLTAAPNGDVDAGSFTYTVREGTSVTLERVEGELAVYAKAAERGDSTVMLFVNSSDGTTLSASTTVTVVEAPDPAATEITIVEGLPEPL